MSSIYAQIIWFSIHTWTNVKIFVPILSLVGEECIAGKCECLVWILANFALWIGLQISAKTDIWPYQLY